MSNPGFRLLMIALFTFCAVPFCHGQTATQQKNADAKQDQKKSDSSDDKTAKPFQVKVASDKISFTAPGSWQVVPPRNNIVEKEIKVPRVGKDTEDGRLTIMGATGSIDANIERWYGQFKQPDGSSTKDKAKVSKKTVAGQTVHLVDISGMFSGMGGGPFAPKTAAKENQRMLAAIIETQKHGKYFVKLTGPAATIKANEKGFKSLIESLAIAK